MPNVRSNYKPEWEEEKDISGEKISRWVRKISEYRVKCNICNKEFNADVLGINALTRHAKQKKKKS